ncbi:AAA family ATPase, partial [Patescibacteria group bacterium]|nr:AAA family ATPase [Patescibacteria group bacterium]
MITRIYNDLNKYLKPNEVLIIYGPRRVGKTILLKNFLAHTSLKYRLENGGNSEIQEIFASMRADTLYRYAEGYDLIAIDEAQYIPHIGEGLKLLIETVPHIKIIATGSASFELSNKVGEPLTDRNTTLRLFPVSQLELRKQINDYELSKNNEEYLIYGSYPKVLTLQTLKEKSLLLRSLVDSYLLKDILALENIKGSKILLDLLRLLAGGGSPN